MRWVNDDQNVADVITVARTVDFDRTLIGRRLAAQLHARRTRTLELGPTACQVHRP